MDNTVCCPICLEEISGNNTQLKCQHIFHKECIAEWFSLGHYFCPLCKRTMYDIVEEKQREMLDKIITEMIVVCIIFGCFIRYILLSSKDQNISLIIL